MAKARPGLMPPVSSGGVPVYRRVDVGLTSDRPFRFCTMRWDAPARRRIVPVGDTPGEFLSRYVELDMPATEAPDCIPMHGHEFYEFVLCRAGAAVHMTPSGEQPFRRGLAALLVPGATHGFLSLAGTVKTNLYLDAAWFQQELWFHSPDPGLVRTLLARSLFATQPDERILALELPEGDVAACEAELEIMREEVACARPSLLTFNAGLLKILSVLARCARASGRYQDEPLNPVVWRAARRIEHLIDGQEPFSASDVARELGLSSPHLNRLFREHAGTSPARHYNGRRLHHARRLLADGRDSIADVAARLLYADQSHFTRSFREESGLTPRQFRERESRVPADSIPTPATETAP